MPHTYKLIDALIRYTDEVFYYGVDISSVLPLEGGMFFKPVLDEMPELDDELHHLGIHQSQITEEDFHESLFTATSYAPLLRQLGSRLRGGNSLTTLQASPGWGKSSFLSSAVRDIRSSGGRCITINFKKSSALLEDGEKNPNQNVLTHIHKSIHSQCKRLVRDNLKTNSRILAHILAGVSDFDLHFDSNTKRRHMLKGLAPHLNQFQDELLWCIRHSPVTANMPRADRINAWEHFIQGDHYIDETPAPDYFYKHYYTSMTTAHWISLVISLSADKPTCLVFDNIDNLEIPELTQCYSYAISLHNDLNSLCKTLVAVRTTNFIRSSSMRRDSKGAYATSVSAPDFICEPSANSKTSYHARTQHLIKQKESNNEKFDAQSIHFFDYIIRRCEFAWSTLDMNSLSSKDPRRRAMQAVIENAAKLAKCLLEKNVTQIANNNMRSIASLFIEFLHDLYRLESMKFTTPSGDPIVDINVDTILDRPDSVETRFYIWLHTRAKKYGLRIPSVVKQHAGPPRSRKIKDALSLQHLIVSGASNLQHSESRTHAELIDRLLAVGFEIDEVEIAIDELYRQENPLIDIEYSLEGDPLDIRTTPLGNLVVTRIFSGVGYTLAKILRGDTFVDKMKSYFLAHRDSEKRKREILEYLNNVAISHLYAMELLRNRSKNSPKLKAGGWLHNYIEWFCIDGESQIERQIATAASFYAKRNDQMELVPDPLLDSSLEQYRKVRNQIANGKSLADGEIDLRSLAIS